MGKPRLEKRPLGLALVVDARVAPFGYVRGGKLRVGSGSDVVEFEPEDLERLAGEIRAAQLAKAWRVPLSVHSHR